MIIDIHAHTSSHQLWGLHVQTATIDDLKVAAKKYGIGKIFLMATYFPFKKSGLTNRDLFVRVDGESLFSVFASLDAMNNLQDGVSELKMLARIKWLSGIKLYPGYQDFNCSDKKLFPVYEIALRNNVPVTIHSGELHHCCPRGTYRCGDFCHLDSLAHLSNPKEMIGAIKNFPEVNFILSHLAWPFCNDLKDVMSKYPNVFTDISGLFVSGRVGVDEKCKEETAQLISSFLEIDGNIDRMLFGSDFPIQSYADSIELVKRLKLTKEDEEKIFYQNALKIIKL